MKSFYLKQKVFALRDRYKIYDEKQTPIYHCEGKMFALRPKVDLVRTADNARLFTLKRRMFKVMPSFFLYDAEDRKVATIRRRFSFFRPKIDIESDYGEFVAEGDFYAHQFSVSMGATPAIDVRKKYLSWGDSYEITIYLDEHEAFLLALTVMIDQMLHNKTRSGFRIGPGR
ncbi:MAG: hypothetical protein EA375_06260 [Acholeplasmataceae bacterium]|nr:MAG: hypothetical protein EA375_06260 [Acholeplasmataceae bacterium]